MVGSKKIGANKNSYLKRLGRVFLYYLRVCLVHRNRNGGESKSLHFCFYDNDFLFLFLFLKSNPNAVMNEK